MDILILGGTQFVGRHCAEIALARGHQVTLLHRGKTNPDLFPQATHILGDRTTDFELPAGKSWDAVIDTSGYLPRVVGASAERLAARVGRYLFVSTISVYALPVPIGASEDAPMATMPESAPEEVNGETYGPLKVACEQRVLDVYGERATIVRPGLIVGPYDHTDRFTYWPVRVDRGGLVLIPGNVQMPVQWIDGRDLAAWMIMLLENDTGGIYNATGPQIPSTFGELVDTCMGLFGNDAELVPVDEEFLAQHEVQPWVDLPFWLPDSFGGLLAVNVDRAFGAGLQCRPLVETLRDTLAWRSPSLADPPLRAGISPAREAAVVSAWRDKEMQPNG